MKNKWLRNPLYAALPLLVAAPFVSADTVQSSNVQIFGTDTPVAGAATLVREEDGIELRFVMDGLDGNAIYTLWWIIFNNPEECMAGGAGVCGAADLNPNRDGPGINPVNPGVRNASAFVTSPSGTANTTAELEEGPVPDGSAGRGQLEDAEGAEIHIVVQTHGRPLVGSVAGQMTMPGFGCNNQCEDQFAVVFLPVP